MRIVSPLLKKVLYPSLSMAGIFRHTSARGLAVVTYHGVLPEGYEPIDPAFDGNLITSETLRRQLRLLKQHYNIISPDDLLAWREGRLELPSRAVLLTCDDGLLNCLTDMLPVLQAEDVRCLFFVTGASAEDARTMLWYEELFLLLLRAPAGQFKIEQGRISIGGELASKNARRALWWDTVKRLSQVDAETRVSILHAVRTQLNSEGPREFEQNPASGRRFGLLTRDDLRQLADAGMTIGAHTLSHPVLSQLPLELARTEIATSRAALAAILQKRVWAFAYPFGDVQSVNPEVLAMPESAGFAAAFLNYGGGLGTSLPSYGLPRIHVTAEMRLPEFEAHVSGFYSRLQRVGRKPQQSAELRA